jgi:hypothetical protein
MQTEVGSPRSNGGVPFNKFRVCRFLVIWIAAILLIYAAFHLLTTRTAGHTIVAPHGSSSSDK